MIRLYNERHSTSTSTALALGDIITAKHLRRIAKRLCPDPGNCTECLSNADGLNGHRNTVQFMPTEYRPDWDGNFYYRLIPWGGKFS